MGSGTIDKAKGRAKEAAGALAGDRKLKSEGKLDQAAGKVKDTVDRWPTRPNAPFAAANNPSAEASLVVRRNET